MNDNLYDELAALERTHWWVQGRRRIVASLLRRRLTPQGRTILDIGCGTGEMLDMLLEFGSVSGVDAAQKAVNYSRARFGDRIDIRVGRVPEALTERVDMVTAFDVLEHLDDDGAVLRGIHDVLPPGGAFVCTVPAFQFLWSYHDEINHHRRRYTRRSLRRALAAAGFHVEHVTYFNFLLFPVVSAVRLLNRVWGEKRTESDLTLPPPRVNRLLTRLFASERHLLRYTRLPVGVSLFAFCRKPGPVSAIGGTSPKGAVAAPRTDGRGWKAS